MIHPLIESKNERRNQSITFIMLNTLKDFFHQREKRNFLEAPSTENKSYISTELPFKCCTQTFSSAFKSKILRRILKESVLIVETDIECSLISDLLYNCKVTYYFILFCTNYTYILM